MSQEQHFREMTTSQSTFLLLTHEIFRQTADSFINYSATACTSRGSALAGSARASSNLAAVHTVERVHSSTCIVIVSVCMYLCILLYCSHAHTKHTLLLPMVKTHFLKNIYFKISKFNLNMGFTAHSYSNWIFTNNFKMKK